MTDDNTIKSPFRRGNQRRAIPLLILSVEGRNHRVTGGGDDRSATPKRDSVVGYWANLEVSGRRSEAVRVQTCIALGNLLLHMEQKFVMGASGNGWARTVLRLAQGWAESPKDNSPGQSGCASDAFGSTVHKIFKPRKGRPAHPGIRGHVCHRPREWSGTGSERSCLTRFDECRWRELFGSVESGDVRINGGPPLPSQGPRQCLA